MYSGENVFSNACMHRRYTFSTGIKLSPSLAIPGEVLLNLIFLKVAENKVNSPVLVQFDKMYRIWLLH